MFLRLLGDSNDEADLQAVKSNITATARGNEVLINLCFRGIENLLLQSKNKKMAVNEIAYQQIVKGLEENVTLIAVSKTKPVEDIEALLALGQKDFGENYVQELVEKHSKINADIRWHFIGHLQTNKVKQIISFVHLVHSVDSLKLLVEINKQAQKANRMVDCLLQVHIAQEETKYGMDEPEVYEVLEQLSSLHNINVKGLMGMATLTDEEMLIRKEYRYLKQLYDKLVSERSECASFNTLSMGMSSDYKIAIEEGSTMIRIGSLIFGERNYA
jgi:pyridoxal phosphate enzyme (YggS family)